MENLNSKNSDKKLRDAIDKTRKDKKGLGEMDDSLAVMREDNEDYDQAQDDLKMDESLTVMRDNEYYNENAKKNKSKENYLKNKKEKELISSKEAGLLRAEEMTKKDLEKRKNEASQNQTETKDVKNENKIDPEEGMYAENRGPSHMINQEKNSNSENQKKEKENIDPEEGVYADNRNPSYFKEKEQNKERTVEELRKEVDALFEKHKEAEENFRKTENSRGLFRRIQAGLGVGKEKEGHINKEFEDNKKIAEKTRQEYRAKYNEFARKLEEKKREESRKKSDSEEATNDLIEAWYLTGEAISIKEKREDGNEEEKKISVLEYMNRQEADLIKIREGALSEKKKSLYKKYQEKRKAMSFKKRLALDCLVTLGVGGAVAGSIYGVAGLATYFGAVNISKVVGKKLLIKAGIAVAAGVGAKKILDYDKRKVGEKAGKTREQEFNEDILKGRDLFNSLDKYRKTLDEKEKINRRLKGAIGATAVVAIGHEFADAWSDAFDDGAGFDSNKIPGRNEESKIGSRPGMEDREDMYNRNSEDNVERYRDRIDRRSMYDNLKNEDYEDGHRPGSGDRRDMYKGMDEDNVERYRDRVDRRMMYDNLSEKGENVGVNQESLDNFREQQEAVADIKNYEKLNHSFELAEGGNVWNSLSEHLNGDRQEVAKVLAGFREETMKDLMENHGMSEVQANQFVEWRYRHMDIGTEFELKDGKLNIPDFDDDKIITRFEKTEFNDSDSINDTMENAGRDRVQGFDDIADRNGTVEVTEPVEAEEILDPEISAKIDGSIDNLRQQIYGGQDYEWDVMRDKNAWDVVEGKYGNPIKEGTDGLGHEVNEVVESERGSIADNGLDQAEINNRKQLRELLLSRIKETGIQPREGTLTQPSESVEEFLRRTEEILIKNKK